MIIPNFSPCQLQPNSSGVEFQSTISKFNCTWSWLTPANFMFLTFVSWCVEIKGLYEGYVLHCSLHWISSGQNNWKLEISLISIFLCDHYLQQTKHMYILTWNLQPTCTTLLDHHFWMDLQIREAINNSLATKVKSYCKNSPSEAIQPLLDLLGQQFVEKYLSYYKQVNYYMFFSHTVGTTLSLLNACGSMQYMFVNTCKGKRKAIFCHEIHYLLPAGQCISLYLITSWNQKRRSSEVA